MKPDYRAQKLQDELKKIIEGEPPYDIFVRWKPLCHQPIGWQPDLNDGVTVNIRPLMLSADVGRKGAGLLRAKPNVTWGKERGTGDATFERGLSMVLGMEREDMGLPRWREI